MSSRRLTPSRSQRTQEDAALSATEAQNNFGRVLSRAASEGTVYITRYDRPTAVVLSIDRYRELAGADAADLDELAREFDEMLARMQTEEVAAGIDALFRMTPDQLGEAAVRGAQDEPD